MPLEQTDLIDIPDVVANYLDQDVIEISGSLGTGIHDSKNAKEMKLDKN